eukprot:TRINITY_DN40851_c0_g1_i1.p1 TRINITY_DN40851_c0_g1~~TRINITY_DN40851_c0_g1_i1.p1  ORF type:complete len:723 (+),score=156.40 TRINITY_DN40851_c0_g1_i1:81-2249(+)
MYKLCTLGFGLALFLFHANAARVESEEGTMEAVPPEEGPAPEIEDIDDDSESDVEVQFEGGDEEQHEVGQRATAAERKAAGATADQLKQEGYGAIEIKSAGFSDAELWLADFTEDELVQAGIVDATFEVNQDEHNDPSLVLAEFGEDFFFGLATAAAHVEEATPQDPWVKFAKEGMDKKPPYVAAYKNTPNPDIRLKFWTQPEVEIDLAAKTGVTVFRMGIEWGRLVPQHPKQGGYGVQDKEALKRYREICEYVKKTTEEKKGMKLMLTLYHHSIPSWSADEGGWMNPETQAYFESFSRDVMTELNDLVDYWVTFNEPHVFALLTYCAGMWPPGPKQPWYSALACMRGGLTGSKSGAYMKAIKNIEESHRNLYLWAHGSLTKPPYIGVAHNVAHNVASGLADKTSVRITEKLFKMGFTDGISGHIDWLGLNYYSKEIISSGGVAIVPDEAGKEEYSESGRAIYPDGLFSVLMQFYNRYYKSDNKDWRSKVSGKIPPVIITENGIADATDVFRPAYMVEHLLAVREAMRQGVPIVGYIHWTISDNWEWADGYCPKFGMVAVDRLTPNLDRKERDSYFFWKALAESKKVTEKNRNDAWNNVTAAIRGQEPRPFCRDDDGATGLDEPKDRAFANKDWRFTKLSQAENACYYTPWEQARSKWFFEIPSAKISVATDGTCKALPKKNGKPWCSKVPTTLRRERRCPRDRFEIREHRVCEGATLGCTN